MKKILSAVLAVCLFFSAALPVLADQADEPSPWAQNAVEVAIYWGLIPAELQCEYQKDMTRAEFAKMAIYFLSLQYSYPTFWADGVSDDATTKDFVCYLLEESLDETQEDDIPRYQETAFLEDVPEKLREEVEKGGWRELLAAMTPFAESSDPDRADDFFFIHAAYVLGIVNGRDDGTFGPDDPITRREAAAMLDRVYQVYASAPLNKARLTQYIDKDEIGFWAETSVARMVKYEIMTGTAEDAFSPRSHYTREQCFATFYRLRHNTPVSMDNYNLPYLTKLDEKLGSVYHKNVDVWKRWDTDDAIVITGQSGMASLAAFHGTQMSPLLFVLYRSDDKTDICLPDDADYAFVSSVSLSEDQQYVYYEARFSEGDYKPYRICIKTSEIEELS